MFSEFSRNIQKCYDFVTLRKYILKVIKYFMNKSNAVFTEPFMPKTHNDYKILQELTQEIMWYRWELVICDSCNKVVWKKELFWIPQSWFHSKTIKELIYERWTNLFECVWCWKEMKFMYWNEYIDKLKRRYSESVENFLTISRNERGETVWYSHCYVRDLPAIFDDELSGHFRKIWLEKIRNDIEEILEKPIKNIYFKSFLWLVEAYCSPVNTFEQIQKTKFPIEQVPSIAEVDKNQSLYSIYKNIWWLELFYDKKELTDYSSNAHWVLIISQNPSEIYKRYLSGWIRKYIQELKKKENKLQ
jgi:hypothetical protein